MAAKRPNPASHSDPRPLPPIGARVDRHPATSAGDQPGTLRVVIADGDAGTEIVGAEALAQLPSLLGEDRPPIWADLIAPTPAQAQEVGIALSLHPLIVEDVLEGNQRAKIESTDGVVHIVLFHLEYGDRCFGVRDGHRPRRRVPPDCPRQRVGSADGAPPAEWGGGRAEARTGPPAVGHRR